MNTISIPLIIMVGISFYVGLYHLLIYIRRRRDREYLTFALLCFTIMIYEVSTIGMYNAANFTEGAWWQRWQWTTVALFSIAFMWFVINYTNRKPGIVIYSLTAICSIFAIIQIVDRSNLTFIVSMPSPKELLLPLGLRITYLEVSPGPFTTIQGLVGLFIIAYLLWVALQYYRQGSDKKKAVALLLAMVFMDAAMISDLLVICEVYRFIYLTEYGFITYIILMAFTLSDTVVEAAITQDALRASEERFRSLVETISDWVWETDKNGIFTYSSPKVVELLGYTPKEIVGKTSIDFLSPEEATRVSAEFRDAAAHLRPFLQFEIKALHKDGRSVVLERSGVPYLNDDGKFLGYRGIDRDITEYKQNEEKSKHLQEQLFQSQKLESIGTLAGGVAHDFNNMIGVIIGYSELAINDMKLSSPLKDNLEKIHDAALRSAHLTRQLLTFARKQAIAPEILDLNELVESTLKMLRRLIGENIDLAWLPASGLCSVKMDRSQIEQILLNICVNARDAIKDVGKITIETGVVTADEAYCESHAGFIPGEYILLSVSDNGWGMDKETKNHIFDPFFTTKGIGKGTGLGLATVYGIVKQNQGFINVYSEPNNGTVFNIYFPRYAEKAVEKNADSFEDIPRGRGETILIVEDDLNNLEVTGRMLENLGYSVISAGTPGEAIHLIEENSNINLFLTDVIMPEMNGKDLADRLLAIRPGIKHLFMSGYTADIIFHKGILDESINFIHKPFSLRDLAIKLRNLLD